MQSDARAKRSVAASIARGRVRRRVSVKHGWFREARHATVWHVCSEHVTSCPGRFVEGWSRNGVGEGEGRSLRCGAVWGTTSPLRTPRSPLLRWRVKCWSVDQPATAPSEGRACSTPGGQSKGAAAASTYQQLMLGADMLHTSIHLPRLAMAHLHRRAFLCVNQPP